MREKYLAGQFGKCTRYYCEQASMLPIGLSDEPSQQPVRLYCPRCMDIFVPHLSISSKYISIDGAYFGTHFPHMFFMVFPEARPTPPLAAFVPTLYGFKVHPLAYEHQQKMSISAKLAKSCPMAVKGVEGKAIPNCATTASAANSTATANTATNTTLAAAAATNGDTQHSLHSLNNLSAATASSKTADA